jgi:hypothetical protein
LGGAINPVATWSVWFLQLWRWLSSRWSGWFSPNSGTRHPYMSAGYHALVGPFSGLAQHYMPKRRPSVWGFGILTSPSPHKPSAEARHLMPERRPSVWGFGIFVLRSPHKTLFVRTRRWAGQLGGRQQRLRSLVDLLSPDLVCTSHVWSKYLQYILATAPFPISYGGLWGTQRTVILMPVFCLAPRAP